MRRPGMHRVVSVMPQLAPIYARPILLSFDWWRHLMTTCQIRSEWAHTTTNCWEIWWISCQLTSWVPFLESPESFRPFYGFDNSLCISRTELERSTKRQIHFAYCCLENLLKDQLVKTSPPFWARNWSYLDFHEKNWKEGTRLKYEKLIALFWSSLPLTYFSKPR